MSIVVASPPKLRLLPIQDFWISGIKKGFKLNFLLPLYVYVRDNLEELEKNISFVFNLGDTSVTYKISNDEEIHLLDVSNLDYFNSDFGKLKISTKEHFWVSGIKRDFELTALLPLYTYVRNNLKELDNKGDMEFTIGTSTLVYQVKRNEIQLITGWNGSRI